MKKTLGCLAVCAVLASCSQEATIQRYDIIPLPQKAEVETDGRFCHIGKDTKILFESSSDAKVRENMERNAQFLSEYINQSIGYRLRVEPCPVDVQAENSIVLQLNDSPQGSKEAYSIDIDDDGILIEGNSEAGVFYGMQTFRKIIGAHEGKTDLKIACGEIDDAPRFAYRGMMLDVARHTYPVEFIKKYIDILALHNVNTLHWHLTDDQGWRIEIKSRPELIEKGSVRHGTMIRQEWGTNDGIEYGGYFTQEQAKEIVAYAAERYINVIPEIDMPGHMLAALTAYPELGCTGGPYEVWTRWGVSEDVLCVGKEETFKFLEDVFSEIIDIFPSPYIHVGGDECPKVRWAECPACQARIKAEGIKADGKHTAEQMLQSYAIERIEKFINSKGRRIIGWDEILEGGLAPDATVMSWTGMGGGIQAAQMGHDVVMSPNANLYFDHYQSTDRDLEPQAIGGYLNVERVYGFEPLPSVLKGTEAEKHILGAQANLWTEYIKTTDHVEYMLLPRLAALSEVQWTRPEQKDYSDFLERMKNMTGIYDMLGYNYARHIFDVKGVFQQDGGKRAVIAVLDSPMGGEIYYTLNGSEPVRYTDPVEITESARMVAYTVYNGEPTRELVRDFTFSKSTARPVKSLTKIRPDYEFSGAVTLVDGIVGTDSYKTGEWIGYYNNDMEVVIDMADADGSVAEYAQVSFNYLVVKGDWVFGARNARVSVSEDGKEYRQIAAVEIPQPTQEDADGIKTVTLDFSPCKARYVKVAASPEYKLPDWHNGKGNPSFLFVDEISIR